MAQEAKSEVGGFSTINVDKVNVEKYPDFKKVHYNHANLSPGDCLYLPYGKILYIIRNQMLHLYMIQEQILYLLLYKH